MQGGVAIVVPSTHTCPRSHQGRDDGGIVVVPGCEVQGGPAVHVLLCTYIRPSVCQGRDDGGIVAAPSGNMQGGISIVVPEHPHLPPQPPGS